MDGGEATGESRQQADGGKRIRRHWTREDKRRIVREARRPGAVRQQVAEHHGVHVSVLNRWRRELGRRCTAAEHQEGRSPARLLPVQVEPGHHRHHERRVGRCLRDDGSRGG